ncbi:heme peroxidase [Bacidia gigantensis]|uniref:heme peroxidase n=1 Tax=Bacidia gigantensis TaxID=2732470 RepID=UPI001D057D1E|nr:heme peroxidase [Bacidia gigantensis]KAG8533206.1 heme peroxidase [Bacidia gigantensis]
MAATSTVRCISRLPLRSSSTPLSSTLRNAATRNARLSENQTFRSNTRRSYATNGPSSSSNTRLYVGIGTLITAAAATYLYQSGQFSPGKQDANTGAKGVNTAPTSQSKGPIDPSGTAGNPSKHNQNDYQKVYNHITKLLEEKDEYDDGSYGPVLVRLAWHCSGTYDKETGTGGSNGATMRFDPEADHGANAGLKAARDFLEPVHQAFPWISYSDLWTLAGVAAIQEMQGPTIPWRPGRVDRTISFCTPDGRLPDGAKGQDHLRAIFNRMGFDDREIVALSGAHALGRCHTDRSGFEGPWTFSPTVVTNDYYRLLLDEKWNYRKWNGPKQFQDVSSKSLMMLPTDMALVQDPLFKTHVQRYAKDNDVFFKEFSAVILKLLELGVPFTEGTGERMTLKSSHVE